MYAQQWRRGFKRKLFLSDVLTFSFLLRLMHIDTMLNLIFFRKNGIA